MNKKKLDGADSVVPYVWKAPQQYSAIIIGIMPIFFSELAMNDKYA